MSVTINGTTGITTPDIDSTQSTLGPLTQALNLGSTGQIVFPATQNASSDANTLDDYEEGTWSPVLSDGTNTVSLGTGGYTKVGRVVYLTCNGYNRNITSLNVSAHLRITGMPFPVNTSNGGALYANAMMAQRNPVVSGINEVNNTTVLVLYRGDNNAVDYGLFTRNTWGAPNTTTFRFYLVYQTST